MKASATWLVFIALLLFAVVFVTSTVSQLPLTVASHFDGAGRANAFMSRSGYIRFMLCFAVGLPAVVVGVLTVVFSRAADFKLPNRDYWLAPQLSNTAVSVISATPAKAFDKGQFCFAPAASF